MGLNSGSRLASVALEHEEAQVGDIVITWVLDRRLPATCVQRVRDGQVVLTAPAHQITSLGQTSVEVVAATTTQLMRHGVL